MDYTFYDPDLFKDTKGSAYSRVPLLDNELEFHAWLHKVFEFHGWTTLSEQSPHYSNFKADMIVEDPDSKNWVGLELKHYNSPRGLKKVAEALSQIVSKYSGKKYCFGERVDLWCFVPYVKKSMRAKQPNMQTVREFFCYFGIGFLDLSGRHIVLDFAYSQRDKKKMVGSWPNSLNSKKESDADHRDDFPTDWNKMTEDTLFKMQRIKT